MPSALGSSRIALVALIWLVPLGAAAQTRVVGVTATPASCWGSFGLANGQSVQFRTQNLSPTSADTVLHRWDVTGRTEVAFNISNSCATCAAQPTVDAKPALRYHIVRQSDGSRAYTSHAGQFWLTVSPIGTIFADTYLSAPLTSATLMADLRMVSLGKFHNEWSNPLPGTGVAYLSDLALGALKAVWIVGDTTGALRFVPTADGSVDADLTDHNDWEVMERGVCLADGLRPTTLCGASGFWGGGL